MLGMGGMHRSILQELSTSLLNVLEPLGLQIREMELSMKVELE
jgi:hypothetical protein